MAHCLPGPWSPLFLHFFTTLKMGVNYLKKTIRECVGDTKHESDLRYTTVVLYNEIVFWLDRRSEDPKLSSKKYQLHRDFMECVLETSKVIEETTLMRHEVEGDERFWKNHLMDFYFNAEGHEVNQPRLVHNIKQYRERKDNKVKTVTEEIIAKMYRIWLRDNKDAVKFNEKKGDDTLTSEINEAFKKFEDGQIDKEGFTKTVSESYSRYKERN
jgi:hypothetical protein